MTNIKRANTSGITKTGTAIDDVPDAPTIGVATAVSDTTATIAYTAATTGGTATTFTATSTPGSITGTGTSPITVSGLTGSTAYTFKVKGTNATATGPESAASNSVTTASTPILAYESIATSLVGSGGTATVTFSSIPQGYKHLQLRYIARATWQYGDSLIVRFNNDTTDANYPYTRYFTGGGSNIGSSTDNASPQPAIGYLMPGAGSYSTTNMFSTGVLDVVDYTSTNKKKVMRNRIGSDNSYTGSAGLPSGLTSSVWLNTAAVSTITITAANSNLAQYSHFALYGIKG